MNLYLIGHPEQFLTSEAISMFRNASFSKQVSHVVIDEAHCVVNWGLEFRPLYQKLNALKSVFINAHVVAMTCSATRSVEQEIVKQLDMCPQVIRASVDRHNISLHVFERRKDAVRDSEEAIFYTTLKPYFTSLALMGRNYPKTAMFMRLDRCGLAHDEAYRYLPSDNDLRDCVAHYNAHLSSEVSILLR